MNSYFWQLDSRTWSPCSVYLHKVDYNCGKHIFIYLISVLHLHLYIAYLYFWMTLSTSRKCTNLSFFFFREVITKQTTFFREVITKQTSYYKWLLEKNNNTSGPILYFCWLTQFGLLKKNFFFYLKFLNQSKVLKYSIYNKR